MISETLIFSISSEGTSNCVSLRADPAQPYLADHDIGTPLLGTVMSIEAIAESLYALFGKTPSRISNIIAGSDCLVAESKTLLCSFEPSRDSFQAHLTDGDIPVFSCSLELEKNPVPNFEIPSCKKLIVPSTDIYRSFFHGPAFQVVESASLIDNMLIATLASPLPLLNLNPCCRPILPVQVIECCLQTAGLLDAALHNRFSVPLSIGDIRLYNTKEQAEIRTVARAGHVGTDIHAVNNFGEVVLSVLGYRTKPMPYGNAVLNDLHQAFCR